MQNKRTVGDDVDRKISEMQEHMEKLEEYEFHSVVVRNAGDDLEVEDEEKKKRRNKRMIQFRPLWRVTIVF